MADASGVGAVDGSVAYVSQLHEVYRLSDALHRTSTLDAFCELAVDGVLKATGASRAAILLLDTASVMRFRASRGLSDAYRAAVEGHNPWRLDDRDPTPVLVPDVSTEPSLKSLLAVVHGEGIGALAFVPITCDGLLAGKFMIYHDAAHDFGAAEVDIACAVAHHVGFALERKQAESRLRELTTTLESRVNERTSALQDACRELEAFTYSVSHDLRAPLRSIDSYAALLRESAGEGLDPESDEMFGKIRAATQRMTLLIDDLLALSRISQQAIVRRRVDISQIANDVARTLRERDPARLAEWVIEPDLAAQADPGLVRLLLENLLGNAWKFTGRTEGVRISLGARRDGGITLFEVRDNGAGFDMRYVANLFAPFQRLHSADQFPGSGIGLATVARIVRRHGGEIAAHAAPGQGASFVFSLEPDPVLGRQASR
jgi:signal transduction histidine kinase